MSRTNDYEPEYPDDYEDDTGRGKLLEEHRVYKERFIEAIRQAKLDERIEQAHMAGQVFAGIDPSYSEARVYRIKALSEAQGETTEEKPTGWIGDKSGGIGVYGEVEIGSTEQNENKGETTEAGE